MRIKAMKLVEIILSEMTGVSNAQKKFFKILMQTMVSMYGHINFRSLSRYSGLTEKTFRRWFKKTFDFGEFNSRAIDKIVNEESEIVAAFDQSFESKSGKKTWGKDYFWNGCAAKAEKGLEFVLCALIDITQNRAYSLEAEQTPAYDETKKRDKEITRIDFYLDFIEKLHLKILKFTKYFVLDGYFTKKKFVDGIIAMGFHFVGKLRIDANLKMLYSGGQKARGRRRIFAGKCKLSELQGFTFVGDLDDGANLYSGIFYHASLKRKIKVVAVRYTQKNKIGTALLFSTQLELDVFQLVRYYKARFQIEFIFRDAKQHVGFGDCQSRNKESLCFHANTSVTALNLVKIQDQLDHSMVKKIRVFSMASYKVKYHNENLINRFFSKLAPGLTLIKSSAIFQEVLNYGVINFGKG